MIDVITRDFKWLGNEKPPVVGSADSGFWRSKLTGTPATIQAAGGFMALALAATNEAEVASLYGGDVLGVLIAKIIQIEYWIKVPVTIGTNGDCVFGLSAARNDTINSMAAAAWFRMTGNNQLLCETYDGVTAIRGKATGLTLGTSVVRCVIDFATGIQTVSPGPSLGTPNNILFSVENARGQLRPVCRSTVFSMPGYALGLQPIVQLQKASSTDLGSVSVQRVRYRYKLN
jgi:hypothetical protein